MTGSSSAVASMDPRDLRGVLPAGSKLQSYEVIAALGQGNFGITYRAWDPTLGGEVAIKEYLPTALALRGPASTVMPRSADLAEMFAWGRERFVQEAQTLGKLAHVPAVVHVHDFLEANGTAYMVMDLVEGETLQQRIERGPLTLPDIERLLAPLLDGLEQIHKVGFLHRDIKPANIIVDAKGHPTLIDFGASRAALAGRTVSMTAVFTPGFAAAEQFTAARQGPWTDIYGLAATLYYAITDTSPPNAVDRLLEDAYVSLGHIRPKGFPVNLLTAIDAGLAVRSSDRPQDIAAWRRVFAGEPVPASPSAATQVVARQVPHSPAPVTRRKPGAVYAGVAAAVIALAGGAYFLFTPKPGPTGVALQDLTIEDLERVLAERRQAEAAAAEKRQLEEEAQRRAEADAAAKRAADAELAEANQRRQRAEEELAQIRAEQEARQQEAGQKAQEDAAAQRAAEEEAQRRVEAEIAAARQAEEEAQRRAAIEAEAKQKADEALARAQAERQAAEAEVKRRAEAEAEAKRKADTESLAKAQAQAERQKAEEEAAAKRQAEQMAADKKAAEAAESALQLTMADRQRLQIALTSLGFDTRGNDGAFGPRTRDMIAGWQKARGQPATGYVSTTQRQALMREAAAAIAKYDDDQKKAEDEARARAGAVVSAPSQPNVASAAPSGPAGLPDGTYTGNVSTYHSNVGSNYTLVVKVTNGIGTGTSTHHSCGSYPLSLNVSPSGQITGETRLLSGYGCGSGPARITGRVEGSKMAIEVRQNPGFLSGKTTLSLGRER